MEAYDLCMEADEAVAGTSLLLEPCSESPNQLFSVDGDIILLCDGIQDGLCLAVAVGPGTPTGGPSHLRRGLALEDCASIAPLRSRWIFGLFVY